MSDQSRVVDPPRFLVEGQRLDQPTFHALYEAMPPGTWAELINGVVYKSSPVGPLHSGVHVLAGAWVVLYQGRTPGVKALSTPSTVMELDSETQPDVMLRVLQECVGQTRVDDRFVRGVLRDGSFVALQLAPDGLYRSEVFPGLWLDPRALLAGDVQRLEAVVDQGCATAERGEFVARLEAHRNKA
jgi:hypothetical protein